jgi:hypothetical protein
MPENHLLVPAIVRQDGKGNAGTMASSGMVRLDMHRNCLIDCCINDKAFFFNYRIHSAAPSVTAPASLVNVRAPADMELLCLM